MNRGDSTARSYGAGRQQQQQQQRRLTVFVPVVGPRVAAERRETGRAVPSWRALPFNPLPYSRADSAAAGDFAAVAATAPRAPAAGGDVAAPPAEDAADAALHCDPCQKSFRTHAAYEAHMAKHVYCTEPGCRFTCKEDKMWKMEAHMDLLHNRPDAPALADPVRYLEQRRQRFPTQENVQQKVEELYYKASRGAVMPDERRRWMRQHGIVIGKRFRTDSTYVARGKLPRAEDGGGSTSPASRGRSNCSSSASSSSSSLSSSPSSSSSSSRAPSVGDTAGAPAAAAHGTDSTTPLPAKSAAARVAQQRLLDPTARRVPRFYVCSHCGEKGAHWAADCLSAGDDRHSRRPGPGEGHTATAAAADAQHTGSGDGDGDGDDAPPVAVSARQRAEAAPEEGPGEPANVEGRWRGVTRVLAPVAAARLAAAARGARLPEPRQRRQERPPTAPSLYERLTEEDRLNEHGLLLQAIRFFVAREFFQ